MRTASVTPDQTPEPSAVLGALGSPALDPLFWNNARADLPSGWHAHVPFAHWLVHALRPRVVVELGTHYGISYAAFCDSVILSRLDTRCYAIDTWRGDAHAGHYSEQVFKDFRRFHDANYAGFSELLRTTFDEALPYFADGSVDLLHIDGLHTFEAVAHDFRQWSRKLSERAVVLLHDTNVRERDFGVWRLWDELRRSHRSFEFLHGHGLGVLLLGHDVPAAAAALGEISDPAAINRVRDRFAVLGQRYVLQGESIAALAALRAEAEAAQQGLHAQAVATETSLRQELTAIQAQLAEALGSADTLDRELKSARAWEQHAQRAEENLNHLRDEARSRRGRLLAAQTVRARAAEAAAAAVHTARAEASELAARLAATEHTAHVEAVDVAARLDATQQALDQRRADLDAILASSSWRATAILRAAATGLRRQRRRLKLFGHALAPSGRNSRNEIACAIRRRIRPVPERLDPIAAEGSSPAPPARNPTAAEPEYELWAARFDEIGPGGRRAIATHLAAGDLPSILVLAVLQRIAQQHADAWLDCLQRQLFRHWQAVLCFDADCAPDAVRHIQARAADDPRFVVVRMPLDDADREILAQLGQQRHVLVTSAAALPRDHALYSFAAASAENPDRRLIYSDEDHLGADGKRSAPWFKPDFSPELLRHSCYLGACALLHEAGIEPAALLDRIAEAGGAAQFLHGRGGTLPDQTIMHLPFVLYHDTAEPCSPAGVTVTEADLPDGPPQVSVIIPTRDRLELLVACLKSLETTAYPPNRLEIIVVDNNSSDPDTLRFLSVAEMQGRIRLLRDREAFSYSRINNEAARLASGEVLVFLNNDTEVNRANWLRRMIAYAMQPGIGAVGAKLLYPDRTVQHAGIGTWHPRRGRPRPCRSHRG